MTVKLVMLKSGEDIIADVKEIKSGEEVIGYYFHDPLIVKMYEPDHPTVLNEGTTNEYSSKVKILFYPWVPLSSDSKIPCSADWVITITEPMSNLKKLYHKKIDGKQNNQDTVIIN